MSPSSSKWRVLPLPDKADDPKGYVDAVRMNSLGSLYWFTKHTLGKNRLTTLHKQLCTSLESEHLFLVMQVPMSHFKTTMGIGLSIWWALPFTEEDERRMRYEGYSKEWIRYMKAMHDQNMRTLVTHEIADQAAAIGKAVDETYQNNDLFREVFKEIIPERGTTWNNSHKYQRRLPGGDPTTGTFEYRGVGQALQGLHLKGIIQDDNFGKEAQDSLLRGDGRVVEGLIRWHQQVGTRFDPVVKKARRQLVIGNAWGHADLNAWIKKNQPEFSFETHSAEGGCCDGHPEGKPILPSEWTMELLARERERLGKYDYSHFYLNLRTLPEEQRLHLAYLNYFRFKQSRPDLPLDNLQNILLLEHEVKDGEVLEDFQPGTLTMRMVVSVNHAKRDKSFSHCIWVVGYDSESTRIYLLSLWAEDSTYSDLVDEMYRTAKRWEHWKRGEDFLWMSAVGKELLNFYLDQRSRREKHPLIIQELESDDDSEGGRKNLIEALEPIFKGKQVWAQHNQTKFLREYEDYPASSMDTLATLGYVPGTLDVSNDSTTDEWMKKQIEAFENRGSGAAGY
jgi:hypothetical protein